MLILSNNIFLESQIMKMLIRLSVDIMRLLGIESDKSEVYRDEIVQETMKLLDSIFTTITISNIFFTKMLTKSLYIQQLQYNADTKQQQKSTVIFKFIIRLRHNEKYITFFIFKILSRITAEMKFSYENSSI